MFRKWKTVSVAACLTTMMLLGLAPAPYAAELHNGAATTQIAAEPAQGSPATATTATAATKPAPATQKKQKSVLDADVLESPFSFFKDISSSDEDESEMSVRPGAMVLALKALIATLLSTIM